MMLLQQLMHQADPYLTPSATFLDLNCLLYFLRSYMTYPTIINVMTTKPTHQPTFHYDLTADYSKTDRNDPHLLTGS
jgi:hypothetical protein